MLNGTFSVIFKHRVRFFFPKCDKYGCDYGLVRQDFPMRLTSWYAFTIIGCSRLRGGCANEANISLIPSFLKILRGNRICRVNMHTFIETWQIVLEKDQWRQTGHPKCLSCSFLTDFDKLDSTFGTVVINLLHYFQQIFGFARLSVI